MPNTTPREETASVGPRKANVYLEIHAQSSMTHTRKAKGRDDFVHFLRQVHRTETRKVTEKVAMTEAQTALKNLLVKVRQGKRTDYHVSTSRKKVARREVRVIIGKFPNDQESNLQADADSETSVHTNTELNRRMEREFQHLLQCTFQRMMNNRCNYGALSRMTQYRVILHHLEK